jgi:hypothetical protein
MKLTSLCNLPASSWDEGVAASYFLQHEEREFSHANAALTPEAKNLFLFLRTLEPSWARELAVEVLLAC